MASKAFDRGSPVASQGLGQELPKQWFDIHWEISKLNIEPREIRCQVDYLQGLPNELMPSVELGHDFWIWLLFDKDHECNSR